MSAVRIVDEYDERRRFDADLCNIIIFDAFTAKKGRFMVSYQSFKNPVEFRSWYPLLSLPNHAVYFIEDFGDALSCPGRNSENGSVVCELEPLPDIRHKVLVSRFFVRNEVPLI